MKILVIDDEPDIRDIVQLKLTRAGHSVTAAKNGKEGLAFALADPPDIVLLDVTMPGMTGLEVCDELRNNEATKHTPIILMTARAYAADVERGFAVGTDDYLVKPFSPRELQARIESLADRVKVVLSEDEIAAGRHWT
jgi:DNA-binding response OmpR family regulator